MNLAATVVPLNRRYICIPLLLSRLQHFARACSTTKGTTTKTPRFPNSYYFYQKLKAKLYCTNAFKT
jgi:hypothetical protein